MSAWQPIDSAPKHEAVWIFSDDGQRSIAIIERQWNWKKFANIEIWNVLWGPVNTGATVTHWRPLPEPPVQS